MAATIPTDYAVEQADILRRQKYADLMAQQAMEPMPEPRTTPQGFVPAIHPLNAIAKVLAGYNSGKALDYTEKRQKELARQMQENTLSAFGLNDQSSPAQGTLGQPQSGGATGVMPKQLAMQLLMVDPSGKLLATEMAKMHAEANKPINVRPGGAVYQPGAGVVFNQPQVGPGVNLQYGPNGPSAQPIPGASTAMAKQAEAVSGGQAAGQAPYQLETLNTEGAPTMMTRQQAIEAATSQPMPRPGIPAPQNVPQPQASVTPTVTLDEVQRIQDPNERAMAMQAFQRQGSQAPKPPGLRLQDQGESAQQKSYGAQRGQLMADQPVATLAMNDAASNLDRLAQHALELKSHKGVGRITGLMGVLPNVPGQAGADAQAKLDTLKSQAAFTVLQAMRQASKTGGALGQVSDREELMLANNLAALQNSQSEQALKDNLQRIADWASGAKARMQNAYDMTYKGAGAAPPAGAPIPTEAVTGKAISKSGKPMHQENGQWVYD